MKRYNILLILIIIVGFSQAGFCSSGTLGSRIKLQDAGSVSNRANQGGSFGDNPYANASPMLNSALGGMSNMIQGMTNNPYSMQEQQKAQMDYARQQQTETTEE